MSTTRVLGYTLTHEPTRFSDSSEVQTRLITEFCERQALTLIGCEIEDANDTKFRERPGGARIITALKRHEADGIVSVHLNRIGYDSEVRAFLGAGVKLYTVADGWIDERYIQPTNGRQMASAEQHFRDGLARTLRPWASQVVLRDGREYLEDDPAKVAIAMQAWEMHCHGESLRKIGKWLTAQGHRTQSNGIWYPTLVVRLMAQRNGWRGMHRLREHPANRTLAKRLAAL